MSSLHVQKKISFRVLWKERKRKSFCRPFPNFCTPMKKMNFFSIDETFSLNEWEPESFKKFPKKLIRPGIVLEVPEKKFKIGFWKIEQVTIFMRKAKPLLVWLYFNILANAFPYVVLFNDDFSDVDLVVERLVFCALFTFPSVYAILVVFSYYRELSQSRGLVLSDPRLAGSEFWYYPGAPVAPNQSVEVYMASHYPPSLQNSKFYYVWANFYWRNSNQSVFKWRKSFLFVWKQSSSSFWETNSRNALMLFFTWTSGSSDMKWKTLLTVMIFLQFWQ